MAKKTTNKMSPKRVELALIAKELGIDVSKGMSSEDIGECVQDYLAEEPDAASGLSQSALKSLDKYGLRPEEVSDDEDQDESDVDQDESVEEVSEDEDEEVEEEQEIEGDVHDVDEKDVVEEECFGFYSSKAAECTQCSQRVLCSEETKRRAQAAKKVKTPKKLKPEKETEKTEVELEKLPQESAKEKSSDVYGDEIVELVDRASQPIADMLEQEGRCAIWLDREEGEMKISSAFPGEIDMKMPSPDIDKRIATNKRRKNPKRIRGSEEVAFDLDIKGKSEAYLKRLLQKAKVDLDLNPAYPANVRRMNMVVAYKNKMGWTNRGFGGAHTT